MLILSTVIPCQNDLITAQKDTEWDSSIIAELTQNDFMSRKQMSCYQLRGDFSIVNKSITDWFLVWLRHKFQPEENDQPERPGLSEPN